MSFIAANKVYTSTNKTTIVWIETKLSFFTRGGCVSCLCACFGASLLQQSYQYPNLSEGADRVGGQLRADKACPFSGVTKSGRVWRKVPESGARSVWLWLIEFRALTLHCTVLTSTLSRSPIFIFFYGMKPVKLEESFIITSLKAFSYSVSWVRKFVTVVNTCNERTSHQRRQSTHQFASGNGL